jgi:Glu-tRNA(Gln) amidotransferase subunit E-like FAD-binding protein
MEIDYQKIGFKAGLEIHQQLDTRKLFCNCPSIFRSDDPEIVVRRKLHVVAGEAGEIDEAAEHEASLGNEFVYQVYNTNCLVELDEEPPHEINKDALGIALQISALLNASVIPITQIMRKTVINGSNTSGFQRTVMIARDGFVDTSFGRVGISGIFLEEDSARLVSKKDGEVVYRLDRLGIPLVEISTMPDIKNAEQAKETALKLGEILRACQVKRGIGTIRQDINISIKGSNRVELKGFQDPKIMIKTIEKEVERQLNFVNRGMKNDEEVRNVLEDGSSAFLRPMSGAARMYPETDLPLLKISRDVINESKKNLPKLREKIEEELRKQGLSEEMISILFKERKLEEFKELLSILNRPQFVAKTLLVFTKEIASKKKLSFESVLEKLEDQIPSVLELVKKGKINEGDVKGVLDRLVEGMSFEEATAKIDYNEIEEGILKIIKSNPGLNANAYMGLVMQKYKGKISGSEAMEIIKKHVNEFKRFT